MNQSPTIRVNRTAVLVLVVGVLAVALIAWFTTWPGWLMSLIGFAVVLAVCALSWPEQRARKRARNRPEHPLT